MTNFRVTAYYSAKIAKRFKSFSARKTFISGTLTGTVSSGCLLTSVLNSMTTVLASRFTTEGLHTAVFAGGDDFIGICERADFQKVSDRYSRTYGVKDSHTGGLGLVMDSLKTHDRRFDFLSYDCCVTDQGVVVVKQPSRVVRYGTATRSSIPDA